MRRRNVEVGHESAFTEVAFDVDEFYTRAGDADCALSPDLLLHIRTVFLFRPEEPERTARRTGSHTICNEQWRVKDCLKSA